MAGVEDGRREHVELGHHQIGRWILRLLDHFGYSTVLVSVTDAVPTGFVPRDLPDEEEASTHSSCWRLTTFWRFASKILTPRISMKPSSTCSSRETIHNDKHLSIKTTATVAQVFILL
jgi:hypothetical protein